MSVNGITGNVASTATTSTSSAYSTARTAPAASTSAAASSSSSSSATDAASTGVVYERSSESASSKQATYKPNTELVNKLKADAAAHTQQLESIVNQLISGQGKSFSLATGTNLKDFFSNLSVDPATRAQAQKDIADDGYWGVNQTSDRIFEFAKALSGGDPDKMEEMRSAFEKGFKKATKAWGDSLPDISQRTYDRVQSLFDDYKNQQSNGVAE